MSTAKDIHVAPIKVQDAAKLVKALHYSGTTAQNSQLHLGVFLAGRLEGVMQFGPPMDKRRVLSLVEGTQWNGMLELNRMAFSDRLPKNSESRALSIAFKIIKKNYPHIDWLLSFSDATQCGDGAIYRASGFILTQVKENRSILQLPDGEKIVVLSITSSENKKRELCKRFRMPFYSGASLSPFIKLGAKYLPGFQLRYIYFLNPDAKKRLTVPILPFSEIQRRGAGMYKGKPRATSIDSDAANIQLAEGGATPTVALNEADNA